RGLDLAHLLQEEAGRGEMAPARAGEPRRGRRLGQWPGPLALGPLQRRGLCDQHPDGPVDQADQGRFRATRPLRVPAAGPILAGPHRRLSLSRKRVAIDLVRDSVAQRGTAIHAQGTLSARPETRYARSGDVHLAYQVFGEGDLDLVVVNGFTTHVELVWEHESATRFYEGLASFARVINFDRRGS